MLHFFFAWEKNKKKSVIGPQLPAEVERVGKARKRWERRRSIDEVLSGAAWGRILALREIWWCRNDIFRAAVRVIDEYQMLSITPWKEKNDEKKATTNKGWCRNKRKKNQRRDLIQDHNKILNTNSLLLGRCLMYLRVRWCWFVWF